MIAAPGVATIGELEIIDFLKGSVAAGTGLLIDTRMPADFATGSIPGAVNVPTEALEPTNRYQPDILKAFGATDDGNGLVFGAARELVIFANGNWDGDAIATVTYLIGAGYSGRETDPMLEMTTSVLSGIGAMTGQVDTRIGNATPAATTPLELLVVKALQDGRADADIDSLVNEAAVAGEVVVPKVLVTADGRVDTHVLLSAIVEQATIAAGGAPAPIPNVPTGDGTGVEVRVIQRAAETEQYRFYTVNEGDSLGAIAIKCYGSVDKFPLIFEANRSILSSPDRIRTGQRLTIPAA